MYRDVKKKLLSVALCICMIIGMVQVVPRVKAAATKSDGYYQVTVSEIGVDGTQTVYVKLSADTEYDYTGQEYAPRISKVVKDKAHPETSDITSSFQTYLKIVSGSKVNAGKFYGVLQPQNTYSIDETKTENQIEFTINPAEIDTMDVNTGTTGKPVLKYADGGVKPQLDSVVITLKNNVSTTITYTGSQIDSYCSVSAISEVGRNKESIVTLKENQNFKNWNDVNLSQKVKCDVAYDLGDARFIELADDTFSYTGQDLSSEVKMTIYDKSHNPILTGANIDTIGLRVTFNKTQVLEAGDYTVTVTPSGGEKTAVELGNKNDLYTGTFTAPFHVGLKTATSFTVKAWDIDQQAVKQLSGDGSYLYRISLDQKNSSGEVLPKDLLIEIDGNKLDENQYTLRFEDVQGNAVRPTKAGQYKMYVTPDPSTNYTGETMVLYYVYSELIIKNIRFADVVDSNTHTLSYIGKGRKIQELTVEDSSGNVLSGSYYDIEYWYYDNEWKKAAGFDGAGMETVGDKRIVIQGKNAYRNESVTWDYTIAKVHMTESAEAKNFVLKIDGATSYDYTGQAIKPKYTFTYYGTAVDKKYYDEIWDNNINAGTAKLTVRAKTNSPFDGSLSVEFTIKALQLSAAEFIGDGISSDASEYSYTGQPIVPQLKIGDYVLKEGSDYTCYYGIVATGDEQTNAPSALGEYILNLSPGTNNNIQGSSWGDNKNYSIIQRDISNDKGASFYLSGGSTVEWNGGVTEPGVVCGSMAMEKGSDYTVRYENNAVPTSGVSASAIVTGINNFKGQKTIYFEISKRKISNANVKVTPKVTGTAGNYQVTFTVRDEGESVAKPSLADGTDYEVTNVVYETEDDYTGLTKTDLDHLQRAGVYTVTLAGAGNYEDTTEVTVECGINLATAEIKLGEGIFTYNGKEQYPSITVKSADGKKTTFIQGDDKKTSAFYPVFSRESSVDVPDGYENIYAGTVYVKAVGNTKQGYFGTTKNVTYQIGQLDISYSKTLYKVDLSEDPDVTMADGKAYYKFTNRTVKPQETVKQAAGNTAVSAAAVLTRGVDYTVSYGDECIRKGAHQVSVHGMGNYTGVIGCTFYIEAMSINDATIEFVPHNVDTYAEGVPTFDLMLNGTETLVYGKDYTYNYTRVPSAGADWRDTYEYSITGLDNFADSTRTERIKVSKTTLRRAADFSNPQAEEVYISSWDYDELMVSPGAVNMDKPSGFVLKYMRKDGTTYNLNSEDFEVTSFVPTMKPGKGSTMVVKGKGGFNGEVTFDVILYTDINKAEFLKDESGKYASVLSPGGRISVGELADAMENKRLSELVTFKNIWPEETGGVIDTLCYTVSVPNGYTPQIGQVTLTIAGNQEKYYAGSRSITVTVTGGLDNDQTRVEIGDDNIVPWEGVNITPDTTKVQVYTGTQRLTGGCVGVGEDIPSDWDYVVTFANSSGVGLATATITGVNKYSGTVTKTFKITCSMSDLTIQMQDQEGRWTEYDGGSPEYLYKIDTNKNKPPVKLYYSKKKNESTNELCELGKDLYSIVYNGYESAGNASALISEPEKQEYQGILLGTNRTINYVLKEIPLDTVTVEMSNSNPMYTGNEMNATDIGLKLTYGSYTLSESDYTLTFKDAVNTDDVDGRAARVIIFARGNFSGTIEKEFHIKAMPISSESDINAYADNIIYSGTATAPKLTINQVTGNVRSLKEGADYQIIGYLDDSKRIQQSTPFAEIGSYYVRIEGLGNYKSLTTRDIAYQIVTREIKDGVEVTFVNSEDCPVVDGMPQCVYNGNEHRPGVQVVYNNKLLNGPDTANPEYEIAYADNVNAGSKPTVTITGVGSFSGTKTISFVIAPKDITGTDMVFRDSSGNVFQDEQVFAWTQQPVKPAVTVYDKSRNEVLIQGVATADCSVEYYDDNADNDQDPNRNTQTNAGEVTMTVKGQGNYTGEKVFTYYIGEDISESYTLVNGKSSVSVEYNGLVQAPDEDDITVVWRALTDLTDANGEKRYNIAYYKDGFDKANKVDRDQIVDAGTYYVAVIGVPSKGTYAKSSKDNSCAYTINPRSIAQSYILVSGYDGTYYYTGQSIEPKGITVEDTDLPVSSNPAEPKRTVKLTNGQDYELNYSNNTSAGKASIIVTGKGNYTGSRVAYFNIISSDANGNNTWDGTSEGTGSISNGTTTIAAADIRLGFDNSAYDCMMYNGYERIPTVSINGISTNEFIITASNNVRPGIATLMITGRGNNFTGTIVKNYKIKADLSSYGNIAAIEDQVYTGYQITPHVTLTCGGNMLNQGSDYTVTYLNNTNVGVATVMATATNDSYYIGTARQSFNISNTAGGMEITGYASSYTYTGYAITPDLVVTMNSRVLNRGTDYVVSYSNNINVGTATMRVTGIGSYSGTKTINYTIEAKNIENCLTTAVTNYQYTGNTYTPNVTVTDSSTGKTLVAGTDYTITYSNNTNPGTASIMVTALSKNYTGSKVIPFKITSAAVSGLRTSAIKNNSMKLSWSAQDYADGYQICNTSNRVIATTSKNSYTVKGLTSCTTYKFKVRSYVENVDGSVSYGDFSTAVSAKTMLNTPKLTAKSTKKGKVTLTWTNVAKATGYEIYYSTKKNGIYTRLKTVSKSSGRKYVDSGLASGERYYYTIRAYRTANGVKTYSNYNTIKSVKVK